jgi:dihydrofolate reductase
MPPAAARSIITLHMVASLDGFIARPDNTVSWLESPPDAYPQGAPEGNANDAATVIDCFVMGSRTYEHALQLGWPYGEIPVVVTTTRNLSAPRKSVEFYSGDLTKLVRETLAPRFANVWLVGGAQLCQQFLALGLVDDIRLTIAPVLLGSGLRLFSDAALESRWHLVNVTAYKTAFVELHYTKP